MSEKSQYNEYDPCNEFLLVTMTIQLGMKQENEGILMGYNFNF